MARRRFGRKRHYYYLANRGSSSFFQHQGQDVAEDAFDYSIACVLLRTIESGAAERPAGATMYRLYDYLPSGNGYKARLVLKQLGIAYELIQVDIMNGRSRTPEFLAMNPNGRIPLLEVPGRGYLPESHAIISFLADGSHLIPSDAFDRARMWQWLCFEQYHVEPNIGTARFWTTLLHKTRADLGDKLIEKKKSGYAALDVLEEGLRGRQYLVAERYTLADISLFAYTHVAHEGGFDLAPYPNVRGWCDRVASQPGWTPITEA